MLGIELVEFSKIYGNGYYDDFAGLATYAYPSKSLDTSKELVGDYFLWHINEFYPLLEEVDGEVLLNNIITDSCKYNCRDDKMCQKEVSKVVSETLKSKLDELATKQKTGDEVTDWVNAIKQCAYCIRNNIEFHA